MNQMRMLLLITAILTWNPTRAYTEVEVYSATRVVLGSYNKAGDPGSNAVPWSFLKVYEVTVDDNHQIYILDRAKRRMLTFASDGKMIKETLLKNVDFPDQSDKLGDDGYIGYTIKVSADGKNIYITEGGKETNWAILDSSGIPIKKNILTSFFWIERSCNNKFRADPGNIVIDDKLNIVKTVKYIADKNSLKAFDSSNSVYIINQSQNTVDKVILTKSSQEGKQLWKKEIPNCKKALRIIGTDGENNLYILVDDAKRVLKLSQNGDFVTDILLPSDSFFKNWIMISWHVLCDGSIYCVPHYGALRESNKGKNPFGEYALYFFKKRG